MIYRRNNYIIWDQLHPSVRRRVWIAQILGALAVVLGIVGLFM